MRRARNCQGRDLTLLAAQSVRLIREGRRKAFMTRETDLYAPVKRFFEDNGFEVKSEVMGCDVVAQNDDATTVIIELKIAFSLELILQGVDRQKLSDDVYLAVKKPDTPAKRRNWRRRRRSTVALCRRLGLGLLFVDPVNEYERQIEVLLDPAPYRPKKNQRKQTRLKKEFMTRSGDPNTAGVTRQKIITAYRQDAICCAMTLLGGKALRVSEIRASTCVEKAGSILQKNYYGWFERETRGVYRLSELGTAEIQQYADAAKQWAEDRNSSSS